MVSSEETIYTPQTISHSHASTIVCGVSWVCLRGLLGGGGFLREDHLLTGNPTNNFTLTRTHSRTHNPLHTLPHTRTMSLPLTHVDTRKKYPRGDSKKTSHAYTLLRPRSLTWTLSCTHYLSLTNAPGYWKSIPERRPPKTPFFSNPIANDTCAETYNVYIYVHTRLDTLKEWDCKYNTKWGHDPKYAPFQQSNRKRHLCRCIHTIYRYVYG